MGAKGSGRLLTDRIVVFLGLGVVVAVVSAAVCLHVIGVLSVDLKYVGSLLKKTFLRKYFRKISQNFEVFRKLELYFISKLVRL